MRGETFIVSDPAPVTVPDLVARYRTGLGRSSWLISIPEKWLELPLRALGQNATWERLGRPLVASPAKFIAMGWKPTQPPAEAGQERL
jgi:UDP-glucose 4-epimerase